MVEINDKVFQMRVSEEFLRRLDDWRRHQTDLPARAEAIRRLIEAGLGRVGVRTHDDYVASRAALEQQIEMMRSGKMSPARAPGGRTSGDVEDAIKEAARQMQVLDEAREILTKGALDALAGKP